MTLKLKPYNGRGRTNGVACVYILNFSNMLPLPLSTPYTAGLAFRIDFATDSERGVSTSICADEQWAELAMWVLASPVAFTPSQKHVVCLDGSLYDRSGGQHVWESGDGLTFRYAEKLSRIQRDEDTADLGSNQLNPQPQAVTQPHDLAYARRNTVGDVLTHCGILKTLLLIIEPWASNVTKPKDKILLYWGNLGGCKLVGMDGNHGCMKCKIVSRVIWGQPAIFTGGVKEKLKAKIHLNLLLNQSVIDQHLCLIPLSRVEGAEQLDPAFNADY